MVEKINCQFVSWQNVADWSKNLSDRIKNTKFQPDTIIALARSGFVPGRLLSDHLGVTDLISLKVEHWLDTTAEHKDKATIPYKIPFNIRGKRVLVVDDIVDTGKSMEAVVKYLKEFKPLELKTAVMQYFDTSVHEPDYYSEKISGKNWAWFVYPWNTTEDLINLTSKLLKEEEQNRDSIKSLLWGTFNLEVSKERISEIMDEMKRRGKIEKKANRWRLKS